MRRVLGLLLVLAALARGALAAERVQVVVLRFLPRAEAREHAWVGTGLAQMVASDLATRPEFVVVDREHVAALLRELRLAASGVTARADATRVAGIAGADWAVLGTWEIREGVVDCEVTCVDARTGAVVHAGRARAPLASLGDLAHALADAVVTGEASEPVARTDSAPVEGLAAYFGAVQAEEQGDEAAAFVGYALAMERPDSPPNVGLDLGRLYARMGEAEHAVAEWRRVMEVARDPRRSLLAARLAARALDRDLGRPSEAGALLAEMLERHAGHPETESIVRAAADLLADGGDVHGALTALARARGQAERRSTQQQAQIAPAHAQGSRGNAEANWRVLRHQVWSGVLGAVDAAARRIFVDAYRREPHDEPAPPDFVRLDADPAPVRLDPTPAQPLTPYQGHTWIQGRTLFAPKGFRIARVHLTVRTARSRPASASLRFEAGDDDALSILERQTARPTDVPASLHLVSGPRRPARVVVAYAVGENVRVEGATLTADLVPDDAQPDAPTSGPGFVVGPDRGSRGPTSSQHGRICAEDDRRVHVVFADGDWVGLISHGLEAWPTRDPDLWIATSTDAGRTFGAPRRLAVSTDASDVYPSLSCARDGLYRLVWVSDRVERGRPDLWISTSKDMETWTFPHKVRLPSLGSPPPLVNMTTPSLDVGQPRLLEDGRGTLHLFVHLATGPRGSGLYVLTSNDGETWSDASLVAAGLLFYGVARRGDAAFVVAARQLQTGVATLRVSEGGGAWRSVEGRRPGAVESYWAPSATAVALQGDDACVWDALAPARRGLFRTRLGTDSGPPVAVVEDEEIADAIGMPDGAVLSLLSTSAFAGSYGLRVLRTEPVR